MYQNKYLLCIIVPVLIVLNSTVALGIVIRVPADYQLIQTAIDAAANGDTVLVADGTYKGSGNTDLRFRGKAITLISENGPQNCIIDCEGDRIFGMWIFDENVVVSGFTITNSHFTAIQISAWNESPTIDNCVIKNSVTNLYHGGITVRSGSPTIRNCKIIGNGPETYGGGGSGIYFYDVSWPKIINCTITGNTAEGRGGGGISGEITRHRSIQREIHITNCSITGNNAPNGGGLSISTKLVEFAESLHVFITNSKIMRNSATQLGGGIYFFIDNYPESTPLVSFVNSLIVQNTAEEYGGGIYIGDSSTPITKNTTIYHLTNSTISGNIGKISGGGIFSESDNLMVTNSILWGNSPDELSPYNPDYKISFSDVQGGHEGEGNIDAAPRFVGNGDYHLTELSPCIDKGTSEGAPDYDLEGNKRPQGNGYDMGAYEFFKSVPKPPPPKSKAMPWIPLLLLDD
jgi:hypothetical protein